MADDRAKEYGNLGQVLLGVLSTFSQHVLTFGKSTFTDDLVTLSNRADFLSSLNPLLPAAVSLLLLPFPLQIKLRRVDIITLALEGLSVPFNLLGRGDLVNRSLVGDHLIRGRSLGRAGPRILAEFLNNAEFRARVAPVKRMAAAETKVNVNSARLARSFSTIHGPQLTGAIIALAAGHVTDDQFCSLLIYASVLQTHLGQKGIAIALWSFVETGAAKGLGTALKALGANSSPVGAMLCEMPVLLGRAVGDIDLTDEAAYRCDKTRVAEKLLSANIPDLKEHIRAVITNELRGTEPVLAPLHQWWSARWAWCVNGSQTMRSARALNLPTQLYSETHDRMYRRMAAEALTSEPLTSWDGTTDVSVSGKLENGKTRAIFACDTRSYFAFEWALAPIQRCWRNDRVLLDPGFGGHLGIVKKVQSKQSGGGVNLMLDYDDFNSHHSTASMQAIFEVVCDILGAPDWYRTAIHDSFDKTFITIGGRSMHVEGTLMSGHRATTFINSVLNAAYLRHALGAGYYDKMRSIHTGDDVYIRANTLADCDHILRRAREYGCRMNPTKQSVGFITAEFLRIAIGKNSARGYVTRSIASFVNGNWSNHDPLAGEEALLTAINGVRSLCNRGEDESLSRLIAPALRFSFGLSNRALVNLLSARTAIDGSPVYDVTGPIQVYQLIKPPLEELKNDTRWPTHATNDYLTDHTSPVEAYALSLCGGDVGRVMAASSFSKGRVIPGKKSIPRIELRKKTLPTRLGFVSSTQLLAEKPRGGKLSVYPLLSLVKNRLNDDQLREILLMAGLTPAGNLREFAFGPESVTKNFVGRLSYSDMGMLSKRTTSGNIFTLYDVCV